MLIQEKIRKIEKILNENIFEREQEIHSLFVSTFTGLNSQYIGSPGTAKSKIVHLFSKFIKDCNYFYQNCNAFSKPEDFIGPVDFKKLKEGIYENRIEHFLPNANIAFLDEIGRAFQVLNLLLPIINEKKFVQNGNILEIPLLCCFSASNTEINHPDLEALNDRFHLKFIVKDTISKEMFAGLTSVKETNEIEIDKNIMLSIPEILQERKNIFKIDKTQEVIEVFHEIYCELCNEMYISPRKIVNAWKAIQFEAFYNGRTKTDIDDLNILKNCLWNNSKERTKLNKTINKYCNQELEIIQNKLSGENGVIAIFEQWQTEGNQANHKEFAEKIKNLRVELEAITPKPRNKNEYDRVLSEIKKYQAVVLQFAMKQIQINRR